MKATIELALHLYGEAHDLQAKAVDAFTKAHRVMEAALQAAIDGIEAACAGDEEPPPSAPAAEPSSAPPVSTWKNSAQRLAASIATPPNMTGHTRGAWIAGATARREGLPRTAPYQDGRGGHLSAWLAGWDASA